MFYIATRPFKSMGIFYSPGDQVLPGQVRSLNCKLATGEIVAFDKIDEVVEHTLTKYENLYRTSIIAKAQQIVDTFNEKEKARLAEIKAKQVVVQCTVK